MPLVRFISPTDPRWLSTLRGRSSEELVSDSLVYRYDLDARRPTGCTATRARSRCAPSGTSRRSPAPAGLDEARLVFEKMLATPTIGLYAEEIGPTGEQLGNFPQAFTHLALISAALDLDRGWAEQQTAGGGYRHAPECLDRPVS